MVLQDGRGNFTRQLWCLDYSLKATARMCLNQFKFAFCEAPRLVEDFERYFSLPNVMKSRRMRVVSRRVV